MILVKSRQDKNIAIYIYMTKMTYQRKSVFDTSAASIKLPEKTKEETEQLIKVFIMRQIYYHGYNNKIKSGGPVCSVSATFALDGK